MDEDKIKKLVELSTSWKLHARRCHFIAEAAGKNGDGVAKYGASCYMGCATELEKLIKEFQNCSSAMLSEIQK